VRANDRLHETFQAARVLMMVITTYTVSVTALRPRIVSALVIAGDRRVLVAELSVAAVAVSHQFAPRVQTRSFRAARKLFRASVQGCRFSSGRR
jgi:hypothetical protein